MSRTDIAPRLSPGLAALRWVHAVTLLVVCPVWAGYTLTVMVSPPAGWVGFAAFAFVGTVVVWLHRDRWVRR